MIITKKIPVGANVTWEASAENCFPQHGSFIMPNSIKELNIDLEYNIINDNYISIIINATTFTDKKEEILEFLLSLESIGVTIIESHGGYTNNKNNLLLCVIPTKKYFIIKEGLKQIDKDIFFVVTDSYEVNRRGLDEFI